MNPTIAPFIGMAFVLLIVFVFVMIWGSRYTKCGPNQLLVVSGRKIRLPDGSFAGFRVVKGGGTFILPVIEKVDYLSLEAIPVELAKTRTQVAGGQPVEVNAVGQVKIGGGDASIAAAIENFLTRSPEEFKNIVRPILEKHLSLVFGTAELKQVESNPALVADRVQTAAANDLNRLGLQIVSFSIKNVRPG